MPEHYDSLETRDPEEREATLFAGLSDFIAEVMQTAPGWRRHLQGVEAGQIGSREALARLPVLRRDRLSELQAERPPFGGFVTHAPGAYARLFMSPGPIFQPEGRDKDYWRIARALFAAGLRPGDILHNAFAYDLTPVGHMFDSGAAALGCAVIPAGISDPQSQVEAIAHLRPKGLCAPPDFLKALFDKTDQLDQKLPSLNVGLTFGAALPPALRDELSGRGVEVLQAYGTADLGIVAYESKERDGMIVSEEMIVEIVRPGTGDPVEDGEVGEVVVTSLNREYPMIRLATGDMSAVMTGQSPCGRTNMRITAPMGGAGQRTKVKGMFVDPAQIAEIAGRHPELGRLRLVVSRKADKDAMTLQAESEHRSEDLSSALAETLAAATSLKGSVELVEPGTLPNDGRIIADERRDD